jgi:hypothetical protein
MGWVVSATLRPSFSPGGRTHVTHCTGRWVGLRAGLDTERFKFFDSMKPKLQLFNIRWTLSNPVTIPSWNGASVGSFYPIQKNEFPEDFWKMLPQEKFPKLRNFSLEMLSLFWRTYVCEAVLSTTNIIKSRMRNGLDNSSLESCLRLSSTGLPTDIDKLAAQKQAQSSHKLYWYNHYCTRKLVVSNFLN